MSQTARAVVNLLAVIIVSGGAVVLLYWILHDVLGVSPLGSLLLLFAPTIVLAGAIVYGSYVGHQRFYNPTTAEERIRIFDRRFRIATFALVLVTPIVLAAISLIVLHETATAGGFAAIAAGTTPWAIWRMRRALSEQ